MPRKSRNIPHGKQVYLYPSSHLDSCPPEDRWYGVVGVESSGSGLKSECADIFHQSFLWLLRHIQSRSVLTSFGVVLMSCRVHFYVVPSALQYSACRI